ncbi:MAG: thioredoxin fold domain-containing protein [Gammaproteobacteria bacterium]|nr:thioredoxin fold domain-containing protein [Gammaproteobacteria bacterium]
MRRNLNPWLFLLATLLAGLLASPLAAEELDDASSFNDAPLESPLQHPAWFKQSFLHLGEDLAEAKAAGKRGLVVYFGQRRCPYCRMLLEHNLGLADVVSYARRHFDWVAIDIWGSEEVTDLAGVELKARDLAVRENANFTPSLIFYDTQGRQALMLRGYYRPYQFRAALEYVADGHYRQESFAAYLERGEATLTFEPGELNDEPFFASPPHNLDRSRLPGERPLAVFFERGDCHACDVLHAQPLRDPQLQQMFRQLDVLQLDMASGQAVITPSGQRTNARDWARSLGLFYSPSLLFFDEQGREIIRVDSVAHFFRLRSVLDYVLSQGYREEPNFMRWRMRRELD